MKTINTETINKQLNQLLLLKYTNTLYIDTSTTTQTHKHTHVPSNVRRYYCLNLVLYYKYSLQLDGI